MRLILFTIISFICITGCQNSFDKDVYEEIQGDWSKEFYTDTSVKDSDEPEPDLFFEINNLYSFQKDTLYNSNHFGYYNQKMEENNYLGYKANFIIKDSVLLINTKIEKNIEFGKIKKYSNDTIYFKNFMLVRDKTKQVYQNEFDAIIVTSSGCYGTCPIYNYRLEANGTIIYAGEKFTDIEGIYKGKIKKEYINYFKKALSKVDVKNLPDKYENSSTDGNYEEIVFIKNNKVIKKISFYMNDGPPKVKQLLDILRLMNHYFEDIKPYQTQNYFSIVPIYFSNVDKPDFSDYQMFYLWTELMQHPSKPFNFNTKTTKINKFNSKFDWDSKYKNFNSKSLEFIETDHQRFQIKFKNEPIQYYDLGYNFLKNNNYYTN